VSAAFGGGEQLLLLLLVFIAVFALLALAYWLIRQFWRAQREGVAALPAVTHGLPLLVVQQSMRAGGSY
jgi:hypothetical protein